MMRAKDDAPNHRHRQPPNASTVLDRVRWFYGSFMACRPVARHVALTESVDATVALLSRPRTEVWVRNTPPMRAHRPARLRSAFT